MVGWLDSAITVPVTLFIRLHTVQALRFASFTFSRHDLESLSHPLHFTSRGIDLPQNLFVDDLSFLLSAVYDRLTSRLLL